MSWFRHTPPKNPPPVKHHVQQHRSSPATERMLAQAKEAGPSKNKKDQTSHN